jgi:hypothetical protein
MRPGSVVVSVLSLAFAAAGVIWLGRSNVEVVEKPTHKHAPKRDFDLGDLPSAAEKGPYPKAVMAELEHNFGLMQRGDKGSHEYKFTNDGEAPLEIAVGNSTCQCTVGDLEGIQIVAPGESTMVKLSWHIKSPAAHFQHSADIHTNDPKNEIVTLTIKGVIGRDFVRNPPGEWSIGVFQREENAKTVGTVFSDTKDFEVTAVDCSTKLLKVDFERVPPNKMGALIDSDRAEAALKAGTSPLPKGAWKITVSPAGKLPMGEIRAEIMVHTTLPEKKTATIEVSGKKEGPIKVTPIPQKGMRYFSSRQMIDAGEFAAKDGFEFKMNLIVTEGLGKPLKATWKCNPEWIEVSMKEIFFKEKAARYELTIRIPPNAPKLVRTTNNPATVELTTNCDYSEKLPIRISFVSR